MTLVSICHDNRVDGGLELPAHAQYPIWPQTAYLTPVYTTTPTMDAVLRNWLPRSSTSLGLRAGEGKSWVMVRWSWMCCVGYVSGDAYDKNK